MATPRVRLPPFLVRAIARLGEIAGDPLRVFKEGDERVRISVGALLFAAELNRAELPRRAASIAYALLFALIPLFTTSIAFFTAFPGLANERDRVQHLLFANLLPGAAQSVEVYIDRFASRATTAGTVSSLVFFVMVLVLFKSVEETFNRVWKAERSRTWAQRLTLLAVFLVVGGLAITAIVVVTAAATRFAERHALLDYAGQAGILFQRIGLELLGLMSAWTLFIVANKWLPNAKVRWSAAIIGGVVAGTLWHFLKDAFTWYVTDVASYENVYGTVAILPVLLLWIYLTMLLLLVGGALAFVVQNYRTLIAERRLTSSQGPQRAWHAIAVLSTLARAFANEEQPVSALELAKRLDVAQFVIAETVRPLVRAGVLLQIPCGAEQRYALGVPAEHLTLARVVALTTGEDLTIPDAAIEPLRTRVGAVFDRARKAEGNALEAVTVADLAA